MSPDERAATSILARVRREIADDRGAMDDRLRDLLDAEQRLSSAPDDAALIAFAAYAIHGWYSALEAICERVVRHLDGAVPTGASWHRDLLSQATVDVPALRPAILPRALLGDLVRLLTFRHFFRHGYGISLDRHLVDEEAARVRSLVGAVRAALDAFDAHLAHAIGQP